MMRSDCQASDLTVGEWRDELLVSHRASLRNLSIVGDESIISTFLRPVQYLAMPLGSFR